MEVDMAKTRRKRHSYSSDKRASVLAAAQKEGLTAVQVQKKFGVTPVTYYSWRKKYLLAGRRGPMALSARSGGDLTRQVRTTVQARVREILPSIVRSEVTQYLDTLFGTRRGRPRKV
jgi:transposase-like protein